MLLGFLFSIASYLYFKNRFPNFKFLIPILLLINFASLFVFVTLRSKFKEGDHITEEEIQELEDAYKSRNIADDYAGLKFEHEEMHTLLQRAIDLDASQQEIDQMIIMYETILRANNLEDINEQSKNIPEFLKFIEKHPAFKQEVDSFFNALGDIVLDSVQSEVHDKEKDVVKQ